jgi:HAD superfamily hydrolase (TIGR01509 family)
MNKAFIFDMDGVVIDSESVWSTYEQQFLPKLMGEDIYLKVKSEILGNSVSSIYAIASRYGLQINKKQFEQTYDYYANKVYKQATITNGINDLIEKLVAEDYKIGLVSSSRQNWIDLVLPRLKRSDCFEFILSLDIGMDIEPKPSPAGYIKAIKALNATPETSMILEDSNKGVAAGKSSGAMTICFREHLPADYISKGADMYIEDLTVLIKFLDELKQ